MALQTQEEQQAAPKVLSAINMLTRLGATDSTVSGNATITALCSAIMALPNTSGGSAEGAREAACRDLKLGVLIGALSETHGQTTIAGLRTLVKNQITVDIDSETDRFFSE
jgi:hypothetical protein